MTNAETLVWAGLVASPLGPAWSGSPPPHSSTRANKAACLRFCGPGATKEKVSDSRQKDSQRGSTVLQTDELNFRFWKGCLSKWSTTNPLENKMETKDTFFTCHPYICVFTSDRSLKTIYSSNPRIRTKAPQRETRLELL